MADTNSDVMALVAAGSKVESKYWGGRLRMVQAVVTLAAQAAADTIQLVKLPKGAVVAYGLLHASVSLGGVATIAIGITGATGKYRAAAVHTATVPTFFGENAAVGVELTAEEQLFITVAAAALPGAGRLVVQVFYTLD